MLRPPGSLYQRCRRAPALPGAHPRGIHVLPAHCSSRRRSCISMTGTPPPARCCMRTVYALGSAVSARAQRADGAQHRLSGHRRRLAPPMCCRRAGSMLDQRVFAAGSINLLRHRSGLRRPDHHRQPDLCARNSDRRVRHGAGGSAAPRGDAVVGILNGVDYDEWDPRHDRFLPEHFDAGHAAGQSRSETTTAAAAASRRRRTHGADRHRQPAGNAEGL